MQDERYRSASADDEGAPFQAAQPWEQQGFSHRDGRTPSSLEPAWQATLALQGVGSDELLEALGQPSFRPMPRNALVPVNPCPVCGDGALRTAGTLQTSLGPLLVRACDTCGLVDLDHRLVTHH
ncbi:MAG TPA: hypothetical protein VGP82_08845 [Ktedonobacterales bacterium]|nr:hypothetical protein [Ktedonobacterales bacterium]